MSTDKTLADVQPGGRVRLGDSLPPMPSTDHNAYSDGSEPLYTSEQMRDYARAALSAQPSPGGQDALAALQQDYDKLLDSFNRQVEVAEKIAGRALQQDDRIEELEEALATRQTVDFDDEELQFYREEALNLPNILIGAGVFRVDHDGDYKAAWANIMDAIERLAARQPVGEPVGRVRTRVDGGFIAELLPGVADRVSNMAPLYLQQPAQAVDLGDFKALYRAYVRLLESGRDRIRDLGGTCDPVDVMEANDVDLQAARRVLDSQAVGK